MPPRAKAISNYQNSRYVSAESRINGYDFGIILNQAGKVAEASYACIYIIRDGVAVTPPTSAGILESITRDVVRELLEKELQLLVVERDVDAPSFTSPTRSSSVALRWSYSPSSA